MSRRTIFCLSKLARAGTCNSAPPLYLAPALEGLQRIFTPTPRPFSTTPSYKSKPNQKDKSRKRAISVIHRTGPRWRLSMQDYPLPQPFGGREKIMKKYFAPDEGHGLWQFFNAKKQVPEKPEEHAAHGRAWTYAELARKDFESLHLLWWVCLKERNRIATSEHERRRMKAGFGKSEASARDDEVRETQKQIKLVLRDRWIAFHEARRMWATGWRPPRDENAFIDDEAPVEADKAEYNPTSRSAPEVPIDQTATPPETTSQRPSAAA